MRDIILAKASEEGQTREIKINWIVNRGQGLWRAEFISYDYTKKSPEPKIMVWRALLRIGFPSRDPLMFEKIAKDNHKAEMMKNPLNFQVKQYVLSRLGDYEPELLP